VRDDHGWQPGPLHAGPPQHPVDVPGAVRSLAGARAITVVWENALGGLTFDVGDGRERVFVKWAPRGSRIDLRAEAARLRWASAYTPVPTVLDQGDDGDGHWLVTSALPGQSAVTERWRDDPATAVAAIGAGLRALHDTLPVDGCPFTWHVEERIAEALRRDHAGEQQPSRWHPVHHALTVAEALEIVSDPPPADALVVCHGDACAPNTIVADDGRWSGHVDLGALGVADRWADLAIATWSTTWNYGAGWEEPLLEAYGIEIDHQRVAYYRLLWDLT
jgi:aminoglycoside phosphotransferase